MLEIVEGNRLEDCDPRPPLRQRWGLPRLEPPVLDTELAARLVDPDRLPYCAEPGLTTWPVHAPPGSKQGCPWCAMLSNPHSLLAFARPPIPSTAFSKLPLGLQLRDRMQLCGHLRPALPELQLHHGDMALLDVRDQVLGEQIRAVQGSINLDERDELLGNLLLHPEHVDIYVPNL